MDWQSSIGMYGDGKQGEEETEDDNEDFYDYNPNDSVTSRQTLPGAISNEKQQVSGKGQP